MKNVSIINKELVITNIDDNIISIIIELCEIKNCYDGVYFNKDKWFTLLQYLLKPGDSKTSFDLRVDKTKFYMYGTEWFEYFSVKGGTIVPYNLRPNNILEKCKSFSSNMLYKYFVLHTSAKKNIREKLNILSKYNNIFHNVLVYQGIENLNKDLPKGWIDNLPRLNTYLKINYIYNNYLIVNDISQQIKITRTINSYIKKYGQTFFSILESEKISLDDKEDVDRKVFLYLRRNNKLIVEPIQLIEHLLGEWIVRELVTRLFFIEESDIQNHCIGRGDYYVNQVKGGNLRAFSFRKNIDGKERRYTVTFIKDGNRWKLHQHSGYNNADKKELFTDYDLKCLEINIERVKKELDRYEISNAKDIFL